MELKTLKIKKGKIDFKNKYLKLSIIIVVLCSLVLIWVLNSQDFFIPEQPESKKFFENCQALSSSCLNNECPYYFLCDVIAFTDCKVYDCDAYYGVVIKDNNGETITREQSKPDEKKIKEKLNKCRGTVEVLEKEFKDGKLNVNVKVNTVGDCKIVSFIAQSQNGLKTAFFEEKDDYYNLIFNSPPSEPFKTIAVGEGGISIREK